MKNSYQKVLFLLILFLVFSCENQKEESPIELNRANYEAFSQKYSEGLNKVAQGLRAQKSNFSNSETLIAVVNNSFEKEIVANFNNTYTSSKVYHSERSSSNDGDISGQISLESLNEVQRQHVEEIINSINLFEKEDDYYSFLDQKFNNIYMSEDLGLQDKDFILSYIAVYKVSIIFLIDNSDLIPQQNNGGSSASEFNLNDQRSGLRDWFERNLKCIAGVAGSAISVGLGGCAAGAQVGGSVGILGGPPGAASGALTGCLMGGAIGALGGGLLGYATFC